MRFSELMEKMATGEKLSELEQQEVVLQARRMEEMSNLLTSLVRPGTKILVVEGLETINAKVDTAEIVNATITDVDISNATISDADFDNIQVANAQITINEFGAFIKNQEGEIAFQSTPGAGGNIEAMTIYSDGLDFLAFANQVASKGFAFLVDSATHVPLALYLQEDPGRTQRLLITMGGGTQGAKIQLGSGIYIQAQGTSGANVLGLYDTPTPTDVADHAQIYFRNGKLIIRYLDGGTVRYKYLDLTGTGVTWVHTTVAP